MTNRTHTKHYNITETCPVLMNTWKLAKLQKKYFRNLTRCKAFNSMSDACFRSWFKIWQFVKILTQNLTRCIFSKSKSDAMYFLYSECDTRNFFYFNVMLYEKRTKNVIHVHFAEQTEPKRDFSDAFFFSKSDMLKKF